MENEIEILKLDVDWLKIIDMAFKRKDWGTTYTIQKYGEVSITAQMSSFNFNLNKAAFKIECIYPKDSDYSQGDSYTVIEYVLDNFSSEFFNLYLLKNIKRLILYIITSRTKRFAKYKYYELEFCDNDIDDDLIEKYGLTQVYKEIDDISNTSIRYSAKEAANEQLLDMANEEYENKVNQYCRINKHCPDNMINLLNEIEKLIDKQAETESKNRALKEDTEEGEMI